MALPVPPSTLANSHLKGSAFAEFIRWYERERGRDVLAAKVSILPDDMRGRLGLDPTKDSLGILASRWYDADAIAALLDAIVADAPPDQREHMARQAAHAVMQQTLRGVYRMLFQWLATPERYAGFAERLWRSYHDGGRMAVDQVTPTMAICTITDWPGHHPFMCAMCRASAEVIYTEMGCKHVICEREQCIDDGADHCRFVTRWT
jgi:hypothetical protein